MAAFAPSDSRALFPRKPLGAVAIPVHGIAFFS
jgi:hypothetical protein